MPRAHLNDIQQRFNDFLTLAPVLDLRDFLSGWFLGIDADVIAEDNLSDFLAYAYWCGGSLLPRGSALLLANRARGSLAILGRQEPEVRLQVPASSGAV